MLVSGCTCEMPASKFTCIHYKQVIGLSVCSKRLMADGGAENGCWLTVVLYEVLPALRWLV